MNALVIKRLRLTIIANVETINRQKKERSAADNAQGVDLYA